MHSVSLNTPLLISPHGGKEYNPFPPALLRRSGYAKAKGESLPRFGGGWEGGCMHEKYKKTH